ncbi:MAG: hypothetical protein AAF799_25640 [Myxococcota bacterium]
MTTPQLVVPVNLDVLLVNQQLTTRDGHLRWWQFNYIALKNWLSPEPTAGDRDSGVNQPGAYLHWSLPRSLRQGTQDRKDTSINYPLVPNRWLVVRVSGTTTRTATAWVVESDCPFGAAIQTRFPSIDVGQSSQYLVTPEIIQGWLASADAYRKDTTLSPTSTDPQVANIGVAFPQSSWSERAASDHGFLTAMGPGNEAFSTYYAHNVGVFSMYDDLSGVDKDTLSYMVVGWYANPSDDVLAQAQASADAYNELLSQLKWTPDEGATAQCATSVYQGMALGLDWDPSGSPPPNDPLEKTREAKSLTVSLGNSTIDAFTALVSKQLTTAGHSNQTVQLLEAFHYNLLPVINQVNGPALLAEEIRDSWYGSKPGGYGWTIVDKKSNGEAETQLTTAEAAWLAQLNSDQANLDEALSELFQLQWDLNATWYKSNLLPTLFPAPDNTPSQSDLDAALDPKTSHGITAQVVSQYNKVNALFEKVPRPISTNASNPQQAQQAGIAAFAATKSLDSAKTLKAVTAGRYYKATNPVMMLSGVQPPADSDPNQALQVRTTSTLVTAFSAASTTIDAAKLGSTIPALPSVANLNAAVPALMAEFFLLDPSNAPVIATALSISESDVQSVMTGHQAANYTGPLPELDLRLWQQQWSPLYVEWKIKYTHIPYQNKAGTTRYWSFDGTGYQYTPGGTAPTTTDREVSGISMLGPSAQFVFKKRLEDYLKKYPNADLSQLDQWIEQIDDWKFLSQELTGFHDLLAMHDHRAFRRPIDSDRVGSGPALSVADLAGFPTGSKQGATTLPSSFQGNVGSLPNLPNGPVYEFQGVRSGQGYFEMLRLYDKFGRTLWIIEEGESTGLHDAANFPLIRDPDLTPDPAHTVPTGIAAVAQFPPTCLQESRLEFDLVDATEETKVLDRSAGVNPIGGWVLPNHLDGSILLFSPTGEALGEYRLFAQDGGTKQGAWTAPAHSQIETLADVQAAAPLLHSMITASGFGTQAAFETFLDSIDSTLWTVDGLGDRDDQNLSVLIGRPLALVRARLRMRLHGPAVTASDWAHTRLDWSTPDVPDFVSYKFGIRIGDQATREDGVIGYYADTDYSTFNSVVAPDTASPQTYVKQIGPIGQATGGNFIDLDYEDGSQQYLSILVDPRAAMHAITGVLPAKKVNIPAGLVERALTKMEVGFTLGPILTEIRETPTQGGTKPAHPMAISIPSPAEQGGTWSWWEGDGKGHWTGYDLTTSTTTAKLEDTPNTLREGTLQLTIDLDSGGAGSDNGGESGDAPDPGSVAHVVRQRSH